MLACRSERTAIRFAHEARTSQAGSWPPFVLTALKTVVVRSSIGAGAKTRLLYCDEWHSPKLSIYR